MAYLKRKFVCMKTNSLLVLVFLRAIYKPKTVKIVPLIMKHIPHGALKKSEWKWIIERISVPDI
jgi:hypothetical protein